MRAWPAPDLPALPVVGPPVRLHDTATNALVETRPDGPARMYVCGITPYDATHMGHAATFVGFDLLNRAWRNAGHDVVYVQNVTDVDDPLFERAAKVGVDWRELAARETELLRQDMAALRTIPPDHFPGAEESLGLIVDLILRLQDAGAIYQVDDDLYFSVSADPAFGDESGWSRDQMLEVFADRGGDPDRPGKRDPLDCLLWQAARPGEPSWATSLGAGRPGWHVECSAIAMHYLGRAFDVQGGGTDLAFPHHEMSAGEAHLAYPDQPFARHYVHSGMVGYDGHKMSKSRGNLVLVSRLRAAGVDPRAIRLAVLSQHYRSDWESRPVLLEVAEARLSRWSAAVFRGGPDATKVAIAVRELLSNDLDTPSALTAIDAWVDDETGAVVEQAGGLMSAVVEESLGISLG